VHAAAVAQWLRRTKFKAGAFARLCTSPALRRLPHLAVELFGAGDELISSDEYRVAFIAFKQLQSLRVRLVWGVSMHSLLRQLAPVRPLRTLTLYCESDCPLAADDASRIHAS